jgi:hypothetical protein
LQNGEEQTEKATLLKEIVIENGRDLRKIEIETRREKE